MVNVTLDESSDLVMVVDGARVVYNIGDISWILTSTALVMLMTPGAGFLYSGLLRRKNALSMIFMSGAVMALITIQWFLLGYSLAFSDSSNPFIGDLRHFGLIDVLDQPSPASARIPALAYAFYQMMFAAVTPMLLIGAISERGRLGPAFIFLFVWATLVYDPIARWSWSPRGWAYRMGSIDFAGGGPVHMSSGMGAFVYSWYLGKRRGWGTEKLAFKPTHIAHVCLGTVLLWFGWIGFNAGSALSANLRAVQAGFCTLVASSAGGLTWLILDYRWERRWSAVGFCSGVVSGLVGVTPASGYVGTPSAMAIGVLAAFFCNQSTRIKYWLQVDDAVDVASLHLIGGLSGNLLTGIFADSRVAGFDGTQIPGGWINKNWKQLGWQAINSVAILGYVTIVTYLILVVLDHIPGCKLRASPEAEALGLDDAEIGELAYDYAYLDREPSDNPPVSSNTTSRFSHTGTGVNPHTISHPATMSVSHMSASEVGHHHPSNSMDYSAPRPYVQYRTDEYEKAGLSTFSPTMQLPPSEGISGLSVIGSMQQMGTGVQRKG